MMRSSCTVQEQIDDIIQHAAPYFDRLPGVVVINNIADGRVVYISKRGEEELGISREELSRLSGEEYHKRFFNAEEAGEYVPKILGLLQRNNSDETISFFQ